MSVMPIIAAPQIYKTQFSTFSKQALRVDSDCVEDEPKFAELNERVLQPSHHCGDLFLTDEQSSVATILPLLPLPQHSAPVTFGSTDSSPTTTVSTIDSSSVTDLSPSSSPESPIQVVPLSSFTTTEFSESMDNLVSLSMNEKLVSGQRNHLVLERPMTSPGPRRPRNAKGLALQLPSTGITTSEQTSCSLITSPTFVKPPAMKPRKKPSILSLQTQGDPRTTRLSIDPPPTPGVNPMLRHHHSSPQIISSPRLPPSCSMNFPGFERSKVSGLSSTFRKPTNLSHSSSMNDSFSIEEEPEHIRPQMASRSGAVIGGDPFDKAPGSQELDSHFHDYNEGPVLMHAPSLYLYKEPTATEAMDFDVIINVAAEVANPFDMPVVDHRRRSTVPKLDFDPRELDIPTPSSIATFQTALEWPSKRQSIITDTSTTPRPAPAQPEYIHIKWEHNTQIAKDLLGLCELIDKRTREGKKVLVHCLQGISRSASLIIAYGIYLNPEMSVTEAHEAAKQKSEWITPNMKLIFQIQEFQGSLLSTRSSSRGTLNKRLAGRGTSRHRNTLSADVEAMIQEPLTAPLPRDKENGVGGPIESTSRPRGLSTPFPSVYSPGPASAPSVLGWSNTLPAMSTSHKGAPHLAVPVPTIPSKALDDGHHTNDKHQALNRTLSDSTINVPNDVIPNPETSSLAKSHVKSDSLAAFDFGFFEADKPTFNSTTSVNKDQSEVPVLQPRLEVLDMPTLPGSFPRSPDIEDSTDSTSQPSFTNPVGFGLHRTTAKQIPMFPVRTEHTTVPKFTLNDTSTIVPPSPGLFSPRSQDPYVRPLADSLAIEQSRAEGPKKEGLSMYGTMPFRRGGDGLETSAFGLRSSYGGSHGLVSSLIGEHVEDSTTRGQKEMGEDFIMTG